MEQRRAARLYDAYLSQVQAGLCPADALGRLTVKRTFTVPLFPSLTEASPIRKPSPPKMT